MSQMGHLQTWPRRRCRSALPPIPLKKSVRDRSGLKLQREPTASQAGFGCGIGTSLASFRRF
jgi:hypothetical protein